MNASQILEFPQFNGLLAMPADTPPETPSPAQQRILLIDLENCPNQLRYLPEDVENFSKVIICYAKTTARIPLDWLIPLSKSIQANRLSVVKMKQTGKNSADFGLFFLAGKIVMEVPHNSHFIIISNDSDLEHLVDLLKEQGCTAERMGVIQPEEESPGSENATRGESQSAGNATDEAVKAYCQHLITCNKSRPASRKTLMSSLASKFSTQPEMAKKVFDVLQAKRLITVDDMDRIVYNITTIEKALAK